MSFDRAAAVRHWRISILSRGGLTVSEVDELEDHVEQVEEVLRERLEPEEAFWVAAHRVGTPEALTREFALVRPNFGWELRAQWALLGILAFLLLLPVALTIVHMLAYGLATVPSLSGVAAALVLYASPHAMALTLLVVFGLVRRLGASPVVVDRVVGFMAANVRRGLLLASVGVVAWQLAVSFVGTVLLSQAHARLPGPGEIAPLQSGLWFVVSPMLHYAVPVLVVVLIVRIQLRLGSARYAQA